jgi:hypothetical protein
VAPFIGTGAPAGDQQKSESGYGFAAGGCPDHHHLVS